MKFNNIVNYILAYTLQVNEVYKQFTCDCVNICGRADSLMLKQYVPHSGKFNVEKICVVQRTV